MYNCFRIKKEKEWKIVFKTKFRYFKYLVILFRLINASAMFQRYINNIILLYLYNFTIIYLNNILIFSNNFKEHV